MLDLMRSVWCEPKNAEGVMTLRTLMIVGVTAVAALACMFYLRSKKHP